MLNFSYFDNCLCLVMKCKYSLLIKETRQSLTKRVNEFTPREEELQKEVLYLEYLKDRGRQKGIQGMDSEEGNTSLSTHTQTHTDKS